VYEGVGWMRDMSTAAATDMEYCRKYEKN
jgi:hypothetical protein